MTENTLMNYLQQSKRLENIAETRMSNAAIKIQHETNNITDVSVSVDGKWQNRGLSSLNAVATAISVKTSKVLDT